MIFWRRDLLVDLDGRAGGVQRLRAAVEARDRRGRPAAASRSLLVGRDEVDQVLVQRFAFGERLALADGGFGQRALRPRLAQMLRR